MLHSKGSERGQAELDRKRSMLLLDTRVVREGEQLGGGGGFGDSEPMQGTLWYYRHKTVIKKAKWKKVGEAARTALSCLSF